MQTLRALRIAALVVIILGLTGCGASRKAAATRGADVVPASVPGFVSVDSDLESGQWRTVDKLLDSFPDKPKLLRFLQVD
jgi:hypothetical protein